MRPWIYLVLIIMPFLGGCGDLSQQQAQNQKMMKDIKDHQVMRVTEDEIINLAYQRGDEVIRIIHNLNQDAEFWRSEGKTVIDSINRSFAFGAIKIFYSDQEKGVLDDLELQILEAYLYSSENAQSIQANVQKVDTELLLYTAPLLKEGQFWGMWSIKMSKKSLIRSM